MTEGKALTVFEAFEQAESQRQEAIESFITGKTPLKYILHREGKEILKDQRGKPIIDPVTKKPKYKLVPYVPGAYMTRQAGLLTGFRWSHKVLNKTVLPDFWRAVESIKESSRTEWTKDEVIAMLKRIIKDLPREIGCNVEVTLYDAQGNPVTHTATGQRDIAYSSSTGKPIAYFDDEKAAETDAIKKALSYWGICNDIYGNKDTIKREEKKD